MNIGTLAENPEDELLWKKKICAIHKRMAYMEEGKYLKPHFSFCFDNLAIRLRNDVN